MEIQNQVSQELHESTTFLKTCFNGVNTLTGVGILSIAYALSKGGWLSLIFLFIIAVLCWYTGLLLKRCMDTDPTIETYPDIGERAFGYKGRALVSIVMYFELYLVAVEFLILEGDNLSKLFPNMGWKLGELKINSKQIFILLTSIVILPTTWLRSLGALAYVSVGGVLASIVLVGCVLWAGAVDGVGFHDGALIWSWGGLPTTISLFTFCYCGHAVFPTLCSSMRDKAQFPMVLAVCFVTSTITYGSMAVIGYLMYGEHLRSQITLNLPTRKVIAKIAICITLVNPITKFAIYMTPVARAVEERFKLTGCYSLLIRTSILISAVVVALTIPFFGYVMTFIGAFLSITVSILLPCVCYLKLNKEARRQGLEMVLIVGMLIVGSCIGIAGTYISLKEIVDRF